MSKKKNLEDAEKAALAQNHQLDTAQQALGRGFEHVSRVAKSQDENAKLIEAVSDQIDALSERQGVDISATDPDPADTESPRLTAGRAALARLRAQRKADELDFEQIDSIQSIEDWSAYIDAVDAYAQEHDLDMTADPYEQILGKAEVKRLSGRFKSRFGDVRWCSGDYAVVGLASIAAVLVDVFLVSVPPVNSKDGVKDMVFKGENQGSSPVTRFLVEQKNKIGPDAAEGSIFNWLSKRQKQLEEYAKVPFDIPTNKHPDMAGQNIPGFTPHFHRLRSPGHDPLLGPVVGITDILRGQMTAIDNLGNIHVVNNVRVGGEASVFAAILKWVSHLLSDIPTTRGIQVPGMSAFLCIKAESPFLLREGGPNVSFNNLVQFMYKNGYTLEHFLTMSIVPMVVELVITIYYNVSNFGSLSHAGEYDKKADVKLKSMLALGHSITMGGNVGKMALTQWNPTAFNYAQCIRTVHSYFALAKAKRLRDDKIDRELYMGWENLSF